MLKNAIHFVKRFTRSLGFKISFYAGLVMFLALLAFSYKTISSQESSFIKKTVQDSVKDSEVIKAAIGNGMMTKERGIIREIINAIGMTEGFREINIYDQKGILHYSTKQIKSPVPIDLSNDPLLYDLKTNSHVRHKISDDGSVITVVNPLLNLPSCSAAACHAHPEIDRILGAVELKIGLSNIRQEISRNSHKTVGFAIALFLVICTMIGAAVLLFVNPAVKNLQEKTSKMAKGEYEPRGQTMGKDEMADLTRAFDHMSRQINLRANQLDTSRRMYKSLFDEAPCYLTVIDKNFRISRANRTFNAQFGEKVSQYCFAGYKNKNSRCDNCPVEKTFYDGSSHQSEEIWNIDGHESHVIVKTSPIFDEKGEVEEVLEMVVDVTLLKKLQFKIEQQRQEFQYLFENVPCYLTVVDKDFNIIRHNNFFARDFGVAEGRKCFQVYKGLEEKCDNCPVEKTFQNRAVNYSEEIWRKKGEDTYIIVYTAPVMDEKGDVTAVMEMSTNITEVKRLQGQLVILGETIAGMSHSIKNILSGLQGGVYVIDSGLTRGRDDRVKSGWAMVKHNVEKISDLVKGILYASKEREPECRQYELGQLLTEVCDLYEAKAKDEGVQLIRDFQRRIASCLIDPGGVHSALSNLVSNAIHACRTEDTEITHHVIVYGRTEGDRLIIKVSDDGVGMPEEISQNLFTKFYSTKGSKGTGLGLVITRKVILEHGGIIKVESKEGQGSVFIIELPFREVLDGGEVQNESLLEFSQF
ncbi:MAG: ATP-binding protein [Desulfomonilaceae bacterium]